MMKCLCKRILKKIGRDLIALFTKVVKNRIVFVQESSSGSNSYALWHFADSAMKDKYDIILFHDSPDNGKDIAHFFNKYRLLASAKLIITTHASYKPGRKNINMQLWHGAFIKKNGVMENKCNRRLKSPWEKIDYIMSYSETYTTFFNACMITKPEKYIITGAPRNDFLFHSYGRENFKKIFGDEIGDNKIIFFLPTFREYFGKSQDDKSNNNPFGFKDFSSVEFDDFLEKNKCKVIFKPHPHEEALILEYLKDYPLKNMLILRNEDILDNELDLYELLNACDLLLTDYSSIFYDYLLLDRPMIFAPVDLESYQKERGFLVESFDDWTPGPKVFDQKALQNEIKKSLADESYYSEQREMMRNLQHRYKDGESSRRMWEFMDKVLERSW